MTANFAISLVGRPAKVGRARSCAPAAVSVNRAALSKAANAGKVAPNRGLSGESRVKALTAYPPPSFIRRMSVSGTIRPRMR